MKKITIIIAYQITPLLLIITAIAVSPSYLESMLLMASAFILNGIYLLYSNYIKFIEVFTSLLNKLKEEKNTNNDLVVEEIVISNETTPEEFEQLKTKFPKIKDKIDSIRNYMTSNNEKILNQMNVEQINIYDMDIQNLERELQKAISEEDYETATKIKNQLDKKKGEK